MKYEPPGERDIDEIAGYRILKRLGAGTYGRVYLGQHPLLERQVAIKVFLGNIDTRKERERFLREARLQDQLHHPHILRLHDAGIQEGLLERDIAYLLIEYAPNGSLRDRLETRNRLSLEEALAVLTDIGDGLHYAHQRKVVHRDLKPENILFNAADEAMLADFGIAIVLASGTQWGESIGTPAYMAPEQFRGNANPKSDQYALGCIAYEMLTGRLPFPGPDQNALLYQHLYETPVSPRQFCPDLPIAVEHVILQALSKNPQHRYPDIPTFLTALRERPPHAIHSVIPRTPSGRLRKASRHLPPPDASQKDFISSRPPRKRISHIEVTLPNKRNPDGSFQQPRSFPRYRYGNQQDFMPQIELDNRVPAPQRERRGLSPLTYSTRSSLHQRVPFARQPDAQLPDSPVVRSQRAANITYPGLFGLAGMILMFLLLSLWHDMPLLVSVFWFLICLTAQVVSIQRAVRLSARTRTRKWILGIAICPALTISLGVTLGSIPGLIGGGIIGLFVATTVAIYYGWRYEQKSV